jgi:hypothetical protein
LKGHCTPPDDFTHPQSTVLLAGSIDGYLNTMKSKEDYYNWFSKPHGEYKNIVLKL